MAITPIITLISSAVSIPYTSMLSFHHRANRPRSIEYLHSLHCKQYHHIKEDALTNGYDCCPYQVGTNVECGKGSIFGELQVFLWGEVGIERDARQHNTIKWFGGKSPHNLNKKLLTIAVICPKPSSRHLCRKSSLFFSSKKVFVYFGS